MLRQKQARFVEPGDKVLLFPPLSPPESTGPMLATVTAVRVRDTNTGRSLWPFVSLETEQTGPQNWLRYEEITVQA